jgi:hypothetical protein
MEKRALNLTHFTGWAAGFGGLFPNRAKRIRHLPQKCEKTHHCNRVCFRKSSIAVESVGLADSAQFKVYFSIVKIFLTEVLAWVHRGDAFLIPVTRRGNA